MANSVNLELRDENGFFRKIIAKIIARINAQRAMDFYMKRVYMRVDGSEWKLVNK